MLTPTNAPVSSGSRQIVLNLQQTSGIALYTVPTGKTCRGYFLGSTGSAMVNGQTITTGTSLHTLVAGTVIQATNSAVQFIGVEE